MIGMAIFDILSQVALPAWSLTKVHATRIRAALSRNSSPYPACKTYELLFLPERTRNRFRVSAWMLSAHKTFLVREKDRGLLGLRQQERLFFCKVCLLGATFSSHWFSRLGGFFTRCLHLLIWISHILMLYVDDLLLWQNARVLPLSASLVLAFCSWRKLQMGPIMTWIGWELNFGQLWCRLLHFAGGQTSQAASTASGMSAPQIGES